MITETKTFLVEDAMGTSVELRQGFYKHFRGGLYELIGTAIHSETKEQHVIYKSCGHGDVTWIRPSRLFTSHVEDFEGKLVKRFEFVELLSKGETMNDKPTPTVDDVYFRLRTKRCTTELSSKKFLGKLCKELLVLQDGMVMPGTSILAEFITMLGDSGYPRGQCGRIATDHVKTLALMAVGAEIV